VQANNCFVGSGIEGPAREMLPHLISGVKECKSRLSTPQLPPGLFKRGSEVHLLCDTLSIAKCGVSCSASTRLCRSRSLHSSPAQKSTFGTSQTPSGPRKFRETTPSCWILGGITQFCWSGSWEFFINGHHLAKIQWRAKVNGTCSWRWYNHSHT